MEDSEPRPAPLFTSKEEGENYLPWAKAIEREFYEATMAVMKKYSTTYSVRQLHYLATKAALDVELDILTTGPECE